MHYWMIVKVVGAIWNSKAMDKIKRFDSPLALAKAVADAVEEAAHIAIQQRGVFHWALAGGTTPKLCYELLRNRDIDWTKVHVWFGDERCLPVGDGERNDVMADKALFNHIVIAEKQIHRIPAEQGAIQAAQAYAAELSAIPALDLVLLGMGEDGHTASLFPHNPALSSNDLVVPVFNAPKPPPERVSMGYTALKSAHQRIIMVAGKGKKAAFDALCQGEDLPVKIENSLWYISL